MFGIAAMLNSKNALGVLKIVFVLFIIAATYYYIDKVYEQLSPGKVKVKQSNSYNYSNKYRESKIYKHNCKIADIKGNVEYRTDNEWILCKSDTVLTNNYSLRTETDSSVSVDLENELDSLSRKFMSKSEIERSKSLSFATLCSNLKLYSNTEISYEEAKDNKISNTVELTRGEITFSISVGVGDSFRVKVGNIIIKPQTSTFKVIYDDLNDKGSVIVKNGVVEVSEKGSNSKKVNGFYKINFENDELGILSQASIMQYEWK